MSVNQQQKQKQEITQESTTKIETHKPVKQECSLPPIFEVPFPQKVCSSVSYLATGPFMVTLPEVYVYFFRYNLASIVDLTTPCWTRR